jgi:hypothetical protein
MVGALLDHVDLGDRVEIKKIAGASIIFDRMIPIVSRDGGLNGCTWRKASIGDHGRRDSDAACQNRYEACGET